MYYLNRPAPGDLFDEFYDSIVEMLKRELEGIDTYDEFINKWPEISGGLWEDVYTVAQAVLFDYFEKKEVKQEVIKDLKEKLEEIFENTW